MSYPAQAEGLVNRFSQKVKCKRPHPGFELGSPIPFPMLIKTIMLYISVIKVELVILVEGNQKAPFSIATTPKCRGGRYSLPRIAPLYPWYIPYNAECLERQYQVPFFESLVWLNLGLNPGLLDHWWTLYSLGNWPLPNFSTLQQSSLYIK